MAHDPRLHRWLEQWEARRRSDPALPAAVFLDGLGEEVPNDLCDELRHAIADLDLIEKIMRKVKEQDGGASKSPDILDPHRSGSGATKLRGHR